MIPNSESSMKSTQSQSRTVSEGITGTSKRLILSGKYGTFDFLFPFFDTIMQETTLFEIFYYLMILIIIIQVILISLWANTTGLLSADNKINNAFKTLIEVFLFIGENDKPNITLFFAVTLFIVSFLYILIMASEVISYKQKRMFNKPLLYISRFLSEIIMPILIIPAGGTVGYSLRLYLAMKMPAQITFFIFDVIFFIFLAFFVNLTFRAFSTSPFLPISPIASWDTRGFTTFIITEGIYAFMSSFIVSFITWLQPVLFVVHMISLGIAIGTLFTFDFIIPTVINVLASTMVTSIGMDITSCVYFFFPKFQVWVYLVVAVVIFVIAYYVIHVIIQRDIRQVNEVLSLPEDETDLETVYESLRIKNNYNLAKLLLHLGLLNMSEGILNFSLVRYIISNTDSTDIYTDCLKIMCFFPQESRLMSQLFQAIISRKDLKFVHRLMLYQTERIKAVRQSSSSADSTSLYSHLVSEDRKCANEILAYMKHATLSVDQVKRIAKNLINIENQWKEILNSYPNNTRFRDEYIRFLVDCKSDFTGGIMQKYKKQQIEEGFNFATDRSFRFFIANYPQYLKKGVMDCKGNILKGTTIKKGSQTSTRSSSNEMSNNSSMSNQISAEVEENIGKTMFNSSKTRIGLQNAFYNRKSTSVGYMKIFAIVILLLQLAISIIILVLSFDIFGSHERAYNEAHAISDAMFATTQLEYFIYVHWAKTRGLLDEIPDFDGEEDFLFSNGFTKKIAYASNYLIKAYSHLSQAISNDAVKNIDVHVAARPFVTDSVPIYFCDKLEPLSPLNRSIPTSLMHLVQNSGNAALGKNQSDLSRSPDLCEATKNSPILTKEIQSMLGTLRRSMAKSGAFIVTEHRYAAIIVFIILIITTIPLIIIGMFLMYRERDKMIKLFRSFSDAQVQEFTRPILIESEQEFVQNGSVEKDESKDRHCLSYLGVIFMEFIFILVSTLSIYNSHLYISDLDNTFDWTILSSLRKAYVEDALTGITLSIILRNKDQYFDPADYKQTSSELQMKRIYTSMRALKDANDKLMLGDEKIASCKGINKDLDRLNAQPTCPLSKEGSNPVYTKLKCGSLSQICDYLQTISSNQILSLTRLSGYEYFTIPHALYTHVLDKFNKATSFIIDYGNDRIREHNTSMIVFTVSEIIIAFIIYFVTLLLTAEMNKIYTVILHFFLRIPPSIITSNPEVLNWLLKRDASGNDETSAMTTSMKVIYNSTDPIISIGASNAIEMVNKAVTGLLGYNPEQMLGQSFNMIFNDKTFEEIEKQIQMMKNGQSALTYESHILCISDSDLEIKCHLTLIGIGKSWKDSQSFVIILRDEEELLKRQEEAEEAKKKSEYLLYQILPMDIVLRLNSGEKNISLVVPSATIIFVDVQRFSDFASSLSPPQIMGSLSLLFNSYDHILAKYPLLLKIKLIGDDYMAAAGLFTPDEAPAKHAEQTIRFALDILQDLDDVNNKLSSNLSVRIGINTGGPIIAGVLGTDKPTFDIIGDPINVAARLQSTDIAGKIQISQATYDLVSNLDFTFERRNDVFLKGKGKCATYLVSSASGFQLALSSSAVSLNNSFVTPN